MKLEGVAITDVGHIRRNNEDNFYLNGEFRQDVNMNHFESSIELENERLLAGIFDGMGGEDHGELASYDAAKLLKDYQEKSFEEISEEYVRNINLKVCETMEILNAGRMGSTLAVAFVQNDRLSICNVGDSPIYLMRDSQLEQISVNHNEAQRLYDMGMISKDEMRTSKSKNYLTQHLGIFEDEMIIEPYIKEDISLKKDDIIMICSDGLTDMVEEQEIIDILEQPICVYQKTKDLVEAAIENGGRDNVTVILVSVSE